MGLIVVPPANGVAHPKTGEERGHAIAGKLNYKIK